MGAIIHPEYYIQNPCESICTKDGLYDFNNLSASEINTVVNILTVTFSNKYPKDFRSVGMLNECYTVMYKARYITMELIIEIFAESKSPYDSLAVAEAYRSKGAAFREQAILKYEDYLQNATCLQKEKISTTFALFDNRLLYHNLSELYEKEHNPYRALKYAETAESYNREHLPLYPLHVANILIKIEPVKAVCYLENIMQSEKYQASLPMIKKALEETKQKADKGYRYTPRKKKPTNDDIEVDISRAARQFLHGGKYYRLWSK